MAPKRKSIEERYWAMVDKRGDNECWGWKGSLKCNPMGYGVLGRGGRGNGHVGAHVVSWEIANERKVPDGMFVCHACDNPPCTNPKHLFVGTCKDNMQDALLKGRLKDTAFKRGEQNKMAKLTAEIVKKIRAEFATAKTSYKELSQKYAVPYNTIKGLINGPNWRHI